MLDQEHYDQIAEALPFLKKKDSEPAREFRQAAYYTRIGAGKDIFVEGDAVQAIALMLSGNVRVYKIGENGREITLYRFGLGESCILTASAILNQQRFPAVALVESEAEAIMIPADTFRDWVRRYDEWRDFIFELLAQRLASTMAIVDEVVFHRMDARVCGIAAETGRPGEHRPPDAPGSGGGTGHVTRGYQPHPRGIRLCRADQRGTRAGGIAGPGWPAGPLRNVTLSQTDYRHLHILGAI